MSGSEDEIYSTMFSSLKHPVRRKILRMLAQRPMMFSEMLEALEVTSPHLTYHLESLGELVTKTDDGKYKLSTFGEASVNTMKRVEETPTVKTNHVGGLPFRWKSLFALLTIGIVLLASLSAIQYISLGEMSKNQDALQANLDQTNIEKQQLLSWGTGTDKALTFIRNVAQIDVTQYSASLLSDTVQYRSDLGGVLEEVLKYSLTSDQSKIDVVLRFRNNHFSRYQLYLDEGTPIYAQPQSTNALTAAKALVQRYQNYVQEDYLTDISTVLASATDASSNGTTVNHTKLEVSSTSSGAIGDVTLLYTEAGVDYSAKSLHLVYQNGILTQMTDGWFLLTVGSTQVNISQQQAIEIAKDYVKTFSWTVNGTVVSSFTIQNDAISAEFVPHPRDQYLALIPYWYVTLPLDHVYPGGVNRITIGVWADTGQVANIQTLSS